MSAFPPPLIMSEPPPDLDDDLPPDDDFVDYDLSETQSDELVHRPSPPPLDLSKPLDNDDNSSLNIENSEDFEYAGFNYSSPTPIDLSLPQTPDFPLSLSEEKSDNNSVDIHQSFDHDDADFKDSSVPSPPPSLQLETTAEATATDQATDDFCNTSLGLGNERVAAVADAVLDIDNVIFDGERGSKGAVEMRTVEPELEAVKEIRPPDLLEDLPVGEADSSIEQNNNKIMESANTVSRPDVVETVSDDEFDDFTDFKAATVTDVVKESEDFGDFGSFQADFSQFDSNFPEKHETAVTNGPPAMVAKSFSIDEEKDTEDDEDDDFGDFNDFQQSVVETPKIETVYQPLAAPVLKENFKSIVTMMFPGVDDWETSHHTAPTNFELETMNTNNLILTDLVDFEASKALAYQYSNSKSSHSLLKALSIDTRNILYGVKWKSNMPRFAADLSASPLQPIKTTAPPLAMTTTTVMKPEVLAKTNPKTIISLTNAPNEAPAVFDWSSSGLVNPLDGVQEIINEENKHQQKSIQLENVVLGSNHDAASIGPTPAAQPIVDIVQQPQPNNFGEKDHQVDVFSGSNPSAATTTTSFETNRSIVRTIKLPETHIFTPIKSTSAISQEVTNRDMDFGNFVTATLAAPVGGDEVIKEIDNKIVVKEYHDVEYRLDSPKPPPAEATCWPAPAASKLNVDDIFGGILTAKVAALPPITVSPIHEPVRKLEKDFKKPIIGLSPTEDQTTGADEDEFSEFQAAVVPPTSTFPSYDMWLRNSQTNTPTHLNIPPVDAAPPAPQFNHSVVTNQILLLPTKLERTQESNATALSSEVLGDNMGWSDQLSKQTAIAKVNWPDPGVDADELARFEAAFPKISTHVPADMPAKRADTEEDDEWSDFVSHKHTAGMPQNSVSSVDDEWSDFVSAASIAPPPVSSQYSSNRPSFPAWHQPTTNASYHNQHQPGRDPYDYGQQYQSPKFHGPSQPSRDTVPTIAYNIGGYNFMSNFQSTVASTQAKTVQRTSAMPELDFVAPKKFIGAFMSGGGGGMIGPTKK